MSANEPVLCVGFQSGLLAALRSSGREAFVLVPRGRAHPDAPEILGSAEVDLHGPADAIEASALTLMGGRRPAAVMAMAERTVLCSARLREAFGLPGNHSEVALRCADKVEMKRAMDAAGVPVAPWLAVGGDTSADTLVSELGLPIVLKPRRDSGGRGQQKLETRNALSEALTALRDAGDFDNGYGWLAESWIEGVESSLESFVKGSVVQFVNPTEYYVPRHANILPADLEADVLEQHTSFMERALLAVGVERGITHMEIFETARGPIFGELAIRAPGGRLMTLLRRAWGFDPWEASLRLELGEDFAFPKRARRAAGVWILHPGTGKVISIDGIEEARAVPGVRSIRLKTAVGQTIGRRLGTGQDIGSIHAQAENRDAVARALSEARERLKIVLR